MSNNRALAHESISKDLENISNWASRWLVKFSAAKTEAMLISNKRNKNDIGDLLFQGEFIENVSSHKHLGVTLSSDLKWSNHIDNLCNSASKKMSALKKLKLSLDRKSLETIYFSFIRPSLEYADILWAGASDTDLSKLDKLQSEAIRCITGATANSSLQLLREETMWQSLSERRDYHCLQFMFKLTKGEGPRYLSTLLPQAVGEKTHYSLRSRHNLSIPFSRLDILKKSFIPRTLLLWNDLDLSTRESDCLSSFKMKICPTNNKNPLFYYAVNRYAGVIHARLRTGCSKLNAHLCNNLHVIDDESCSCGHFREDPFHFFMECPRYVALRNELFTKVVQYSNFNISTLLYGDPDLSLSENCKLFEAVQLYITDSERFV